MSILEKLKAIRQEADEAEKQSTPRISANKLAEYIEASVTRRQAIIRDCKFPAAFMTTRYNIARETIKKFLIERDPAIFEEGLTQLAEADVSTDFKKNDVKNSQDLLNLIRVMNFPELEKLTVSDWGDGNKLLNIQGVDISVNPDLYVTGTIRKTDIQGVIKLSIIKTHPLSFYGQSVVALLSKQFLLETQSGQAGNVNAKICFSFDAFQQRIVPCQSAEKERLRAIDAACREIRVGWDSIE